MDPQSLHHEVSAFIALLLIASLVAVVLQRVRLPYTVALVAVGMTLGALDLLDGVHISPELVMMIFLPGLLFEAAQHIDIRDFLGDARLILTLAVPGVLLGVLLTGAGVYVGLRALGIGNAPGFFAIACLVGAMTAATDPISVIALFRSLKVHPRLTLLLEGESLFNDGTAIVFFGILLSIIQGEAFSLGGGIREFCLVAFGGAAIGFAAGLIVERVLRTTADHLVELGLTVVLAYGVYLAAEAVHVSGVIAVVVAGMVNGNLGARTAIDRFSRVALFSFWEFAAFVINSMVFLIMGLDVHLPALWADRWPILITAGSMFAARAVGVYLLTPIAGRFVREPVPRAWHHVLYWGGLRGALSIVLALSLPDDFPHRELLVHIVFGIVVLSCFGQGLTMGPLLRRLGLAGGEADDTAQRMRARLHAQHAAIAYLDELRGERAVSQATYDALHTQYETEMTTLTAHLEQHMAAPDAAEAERAATARAVEETMRTAILQAYHHHDISSEAAGALLDELAGDGDRGH